jgi:hypothetical protein
MKKGMHSHRLNTDETRDGNESFKFQDSSTGESSKQKACRGDCKVWGCLASKRRERRAPLRGKGFDTSPLPLPPVEAGRESELFHVWGSVRMRPCRNQEFHFVGWKTKYGVKDWHG